MDYICRPVQNQKLLCNYESLDIWHNSLIYKTPLPTQKKTQINVIYIHASSKIHIHNPRVWAVQGSLHCSTVISI